MLLSIPPRHILSKTTFIYGCQCHKRLWMNKYMPKEKDIISADQVAIFQQGTDVGMLAQQLFPNGIDATPKNNYEYQKSVAQTAAYIKDGYTVIYEAAFQYEGVLAILDILVKRNDRWYAYEVKSSTGVKETFVKDAALQYYVITHAGIPLEDISIVHLNRAYIRRGDLDIHQLFNAVSIMDEVQELQPFVATKIAELKDVLQLNEAPDIATGKQCYLPYTCDFIGFCNRGVEEIIPDHGTAQTDPMALRNFVAQLKYPLYFLDFETWMSAVPEQDGHWPYRQIPFQFSLHIQMEPDAEPEHLFYLAENSQSPLSAFAEMLIQSLGAEGSIIIYNKTFENSRLSELKGDFPEYINAIENIQERLVDLMTPFRYKHYYIPEMQSSYSIKYILPALIPELSYKDLDIGNGSDASAVFYHLKDEKNVETLNIKRNALLEYCKLDTYAMVKILEKLREVMSK